MFTQFNKLKMNYNLINLRNSIFLMVLVYSLVLLSGCKREFSTLLINKSDKVYTVKICIFIHSDHEGILPIKGHWFYYPSYKNKLIMVPITSNEDTCFSFKIKPKEEIVLGEKSAKDYFKMIKSIAIKGKDFHLEVENKECIKLFRNNIIEDNILYNIYTIN